MKILGYDPYVSQDNFDDSEIKVVSIDELTKAATICFMFHLMIKQKIYLI